MSASAGTPVATQPPVVLDKAKIAAAIVVVLAVVALVLRMFGVEFVPADETAVALVVDAVLTLVQAIASVVAIVMAAVKAQQLVTPVSSPRDDAGHELVPLDDIDRGVAGEVGAGVLAPQYVTATLVQDTPDPSLRA